LQLCVLVNVAAFPGLGTIMAGRRIGYLQAALMLTGFFCVVGTAIWFILQAVKVVDAPMWDEQAWHTAARKAWITGGAGLGICAVAWLWALVDSVRLWQSFRPAPPIPPRQPPPSDL
jgi:hypothetical protein